MSNATEVNVNEMATFRLPVSLIDHLEHARRASELTKTVLVKRALSKFLNDNFPLPAQAVH